MYFAAFSPGHPVSDHKAIINQGESHPAFLVTEELNVDATEATIGLWHVTVLTL